MRHLLLALAGLALAGCASKALGQQGPGVDDASACGEVPPSPITPTTVAEATAEGGQRASNNPVQTDPGARGITTTWGRGSGPVTASPTSTETRSQAGAPSVNMGYLIPTTADVGHGGQSLATQKAAQTVDTLNAALALRLSQGGDVVAILAALTEAQKALAATSANDKANVTYNINVSGSPQTVANGSAAGSEGGSVQAPVGPSKTLRAPGAPAVAPPPDPIPADGGK